MYRVVLVDDEQMILQGLMRVIPWEEHGCRVAGTAGDGLEGMALIKKLQPDILFTDIRMPNLDGLKMIAALKSEFPNLEIAVLTAYRDFEYARQAITLGVCRYLLKPSKMDELREAIRHMTGALDRRAGLESPEAPEGEAAGSFVVKSALQYLEQHCCEHITLSQVADQVFVSQWHLSKLINRHTGKNFFDLVNQLRVKKARELLRDPKLRVHEVAEMVGYADVAHFSKNFKRLTGKSPVEYRTQLSPIRPENA
jgi:YesN/AraC family two-component response regulator